MSLLVKGIVPCFWRAPTDNDKGGEAASYVSRWKAAHLDNLSIATESCSVQNISDSHVKVESVYLAIPDGGSGAALFRCNVTYSIYGSGDIIAEYHVEPTSAEDLPPVARIGVEFHLDKTLDKIHWYGAGPFECYPDRKAAAHVGIYEDNVSCMHVPYIVPGECSGRADVRWVTFQNSDGVGVYASMYGVSPPMQMSASYYSTAELEKATHNEDLVKGDSIEVRCLLCEILCFCFNP